MSVQYGKVVSLILLERFGPVIEKVGTYLFKQKCSPLLYIKRNTELPLSKVKEALCVLIKHRLVTFTSNKNANIANYTLKPENILLMLRYPKYLNFIKNKYEDTEEMMIELCLQKGYCTASEIILKVHEKVIKSQPKTSYNDIKEKLMALIVAKYLIRMPYPTGDKPVPDLQIKDTEIHIIPPIDIKMLVDSKNGQTIEFPDKGIYWAVNFDRFHQDMRDKLIINAFTRKFDENAGEFVKILLRQMYIRTQPWADTSNPVPILEIKDIIRKSNTHPQLTAFFDQYVNVIEQDSSQLVRKAGEASGGSVQIFLKEAFTQFTWELVEQVVLEKFDSKACRIFRLVRLKPYIEPDQIQQFAMIPAKEAKRLSYQLYEEHFLQIQELRKASSNTGPTKNFTLFYIQLDRVARMILELCYKTLYNLMTRRNHERVINKRIIDKKQRVDMILEGMKEQGASEDQISDIEDMVTPPEREILEKIEKTIKKLNMAELEVEDSIFLLEMFLVYN